MSSQKNSAFNVLETLNTSGGAVGFYSLRRLKDEGIASIQRLPFSIRILLENILRHYNSSFVGDKDVTALAHWQPQGERTEIPFMPARVLLQDFTGIPTLVDLAAMRDAIVRLGGDPAKVNPLVPVDLVIDHSVQVDVFGTDAAFAFNVEREYERNRERYTFLRWAQKAFDHCQVVPPGTGIVHQVNLEYLGKVIQTAERGGQRIAYPDTLVGTDSHTTMINALGILGWGVGGIEAEAVMLGQPYYMLVPDVVGMKLTGQLREGATATDLVLTVTEMLRRHGVVDKFVEFYGPGLSSLSLPDRATIGNMAPEYGATMGFFPVDDETIHYMIGTGRPAALIEMVEAYAKANLLFRDDDMPDPQYTSALGLDLSRVEPSLAGPRLPQDRVPLGQVNTAFRDAFRDVFEKLEQEPRDNSNHWFDEGGNPNPDDEADQALSTESVAPQEPDITHGSVVISAITSCTNTSNPSVMIGAGLLAKKAVERGLTVKPWVKTSLAPGSRVVTDYLTSAGLLPYLEELRFHLVGYGCTTCIGNSGPLPDEVSQAVREKDLVVAAVLSGNRNFEARIQPLVKANYLASPMLVVAYALAGSVNVNLTTDAIGHDSNGQPVYLRDIWPSQQEIQETMRHALNPEMFRQQYSSVFEGDERWRGLPAPEGELYHWDAVSTYIQQPPYFEDFAPEPQPLQDIRDALALAVLGDSITTDHISPAGSIATDGPAGQYLIEKGIEPRDFNTYGARRGNHEVMIRGTFANVRLKNELVPGPEGGWTLYHLTNERMTIYDAAQLYKAAGIPLVVVAGKEYGSGSSRDWAAKGAQQLGVKAIIAESYERIHRSNLVGMGVLPLQFLPGESRETLGLTGHETYTIEGLGNLAPRQHVTVRVRRDAGTETTFDTIARIDAAVDLDYVKQGGILPAVLRHIMGSGATG